MPTPGNKTLRIFRKDLSHLWPEIALTLALTLGFALTEHFLWPRYFSISGADVYRTLALWMNALLPVAWWVLIARAVHDESLVGHLQFWVTRPYGWQRLLAAKLLLIAAFILVPFLLAQGYLLHQAGLHPLAVFPGLLLKLLLLFAFLLLPLLALSTVTASLTRMLLVYLALIVYFLLVAYLANLFAPAYHPWAPSADATPWQAWLLIVLVPAIPAAVTLLQYARRRTTVSVALLLTLVVAVTVTIITFTRQLHTLKGYPPLASTNTPPLRIAFNRDPALQTPYGHETQPGELGSSTDLNLSLPITVSGIAPGHAIQMEGIAATAQAPSIPRTDIAWRFDNDIFTPDPTNFTQHRQNLTLKRLDYLSLSLTLTYALADYASDPPVTVPFNTSGFDIPENGHCILTVAGHILDCQYALNSPSRTLITYTLQQTCGTTSSADQPQHQWIGNDYRFAPGFSPVTARFGFSTGEIAVTQPDPVHNIGSRTFVHLCPGSPITFTRYHLVARHLLTVPLPPIDPQHYIAKPYVDSDPNE